MIDKSFIEKIESLSEVKQFNIDGYEYTNKPLYPVLQPTAERLQVHTLQGVVDYVNKLNEMDGLVVQVESPSRVFVYGELTDTRQREVLVEATLINGQFEFGRKQDTENFIIGIQANFVQDENTALIMAFAGNMVTQSQIGTLDDGVTQSAEVRAGLATTQMVKVPNPVELRPYRSFPEIVQPASNFVFRADKDHRLALYEADGGAWKIKAIKSIQEWLEANIEYNLVSIIA